MLEFSPQKEPHMGKPGAAIRAIGWVAVGAIAAGGVATAATSTGSSSQPAGGAPAAATPAATTPITAKHPRAELYAKLQGRLLHGQFTVLGKDNKPVDVTEQRGNVDAVSPTSITLTSKDGFNHTYVVATTTRVRVDGKKAAIGDVKTGQQATVIAKVDGTTQTAALVVQRAAK
jgi:hypothetical protein